LRKVTRLLLLPGLMILTMLSGCAGRQVILHPIAGTHFVEMKKNETYAPVMNGYFVSDYYLEKIAKARVK